MKQDLSVHGSQVLPPTRGRRLIEDLKPARRSKFLCRSTAPAAVPASRPAQPPC
jgi:hypothetical protein